MDATVPQIDGYRFAYWLPFTAHEVMVEDTYYSLSAALDRAAIGGRLDALFDEGTSAAGEQIAEEDGILPVLLGGHFESLWPEDGPGVAKVGLRGGFFHPTTGYSLPDAVRNAALAASLPTFDSQSLHDVFRARAQHYWKERRFFTLLNRMLFHAADPEERYRVLEHFYRLPEALIGRFYAARLTAMDKLRIVSGRPPVPIGRAIRAMRGQAA
jgi:lycopene beta-cyclase